MKKIYRFILLFALFLMPNAVRSEAPKRVLSLCSAANYIMIELGVPPNAIEEFGRVVAGCEKIPGVGKGSAISLERLRALKINSIILWSYQRDVVKLAKERELNILEVGNLRLQSYPQFIRQIGDFVMRRTEAERLAKEFEAALQQLPPVTDNPVKVYFELYSPGKAVGKESYLGDLITASGGQCVVDKGGLIASEAVLKSKAEVIFYIEGFAQAEEFKRRPGFSALPAVKNNRIYSVKRAQIIEGVKPLEAIKFLKSKIDPLKNKE